MPDQIRPAQLTGWFAAATHADQTDHADSRPLLLDVREPWELQTAALRADGFELLAIPMNELPARLTGLDPARPTACLCHHGARSQQVALFLERAGFSRVANISGGIDAWSLECDGALPRY